MRKKGFNKFEMTEHHLVELNRILERNRWIILERQEGDGYGISGTWVISRPDKSGKLHLDFEGLDELGVLPMNKAYGCYIREKQSISAYFARAKRSWPEELDSFIEQLNRYGG